MCACPGCTNGHEADSKKLEDNKGNVMKPSTPLWQSAETMISDMEEFKTKKEWTLMNEAAKGWLARKMFPEENMFVQRNFSVAYHFLIDIGFDYKSMHLMLGSRPKTGLSVFLLALV